jgi:predicted dehydrogenase
LMPSLSRRTLMTAGVRGGLAAGVAAYCGVSNSAPAEKSKKIRIGQIGVGHSHAAGKMSSLRALADCYEVVGVVEPDPELRKRWEVHPAYRGLVWMTEEQLLGAEGLRAVAVETAVGELIPTAARCIDAGMHVHVDKPAGESLAAFRQLLDAAGRRQLTVQMGYMFRNNPAFEFCFRAVKEGWLGRIFEVHGVIGKWLDASERRRFLPSGGGTMFELGCHLIDSLVSVLGKPDKVTSYIRRTRAPEDRLPDNQLAVFEYPQAIATIRSAVVEIHGELRRQMVVCGDEGTIEIRPLEPPRLELILRKPRGSYAAGRREIALRKMPDRYQDQLVELARIIRGEIENAYSPAHDLAVQEAVLRASGLMS